jgi:ferrochelatase
MTKKAVILINLGTPNSPTKKDVKAYLKEFLMDPRVIQLPKLIRQILVYGLIVPFRSGRSSHAYQQIWTEKGSPLKVNTENLVEKLNLKTKNPVFYAMRYGQPNIARVLNQLNDFEEIIILPLYPQYASATTGSSLEAVFDYYKSQDIIPSLRIIRDFYHHPIFIKALAASLQTYLKPNHHLLLSYHGLPERQLESIGCKPVCQGACSMSKPQNHACYRYQCYASSHALAKELLLNDTDFSVSFQSRLGKTPWIKPYTDETLKNLAKQGIKNLVIACPSFVADCLETIEEIGIQGREDWKMLGGEEFTLVPCLNAQDIWVDAIIQLLDTF